MSGWANNQVILIPSSLLLLFFKASNWIFTTSYGNNFSLGVKESASNELENKIVTLVWQFDKFYPAEDYHQDYYEKNFLRYLAYKKACQREEVLNKIWN